MKKVSILVSSLLFAVVAQAAPTIYVVDTAQVYSNYYKAKEANAQIQSSVEQTNQELQKMDQKRQALVKELNAVEEKMKNPALTEEAKKKIAQEEGAPKFNEIRAIEQNIQNVRAQASQRLEQNIQSIRAIHLQDIREAVAKIAESKKADFILEKSVCLFSKPTVDLTQEVITAINASAPAASTAAAPAKTEAKK